MCKKHFFLIIIFFALVLGFASCTYEQIPQKTDCTVTNATYSLQVKPLIDRYCASCHSGNLLSGGINLGTYETLSSVAKNGRLLGTIQHQSGYSPMPQGGSKLSACDIDLIKKWVEAGAKND